jgi:hypothetical protein
LTLSELLQKLYPFYEYIDGERYNEQEFVCAFLGEAVNGVDDWSFLDKKQFLNKVYSGVEPLPITQARFIYSHSDEHKLTKFLKKQPQETLLRLVDEFEDCFVSTEKNIASKICNLFCEIVIAIKDKKTMSKTPVKPVYMDTLTANECLAKIVKGLSGVTEEKLNEFAKLHLDPQPVEDKILESNFALKKEILNNVYDYFHYINDLIAEASKTNSAFGRKLTETVQSASENFIKQGYSQEQVITNMASWIKNITFLTAIDDLYFRILVAYFVQHCEVFYNETA